MMKKILLISLTAIFLFYQPCKAERQTYWVRPAGGSYGAENGLSYATAFDGLKNISWSADGTESEGSVDSDDTLYICGTHIYDQNPYDSDGGDIAILFNGQSSSNRLIIRGDCSSVNSGYSNGVIWGGATFSGLSWASEGSSTYSTTLNSNQPDYNYFESFSSSGGTKLTKQASIQDVKDNPGSHYAESYSNGGTLYVHLSDNSEVTHAKVLFPYYGYSIIVASRDYITFYGLTFYNRGIGQGSGFHGNYIKFENCKFWYGGTTWFSLDTNTYPNEFDNLEFVKNEIAYAGNGIYTISSDNDTADNLLVQSNYIHDIGNSTDYDNGDSHAVGVQGGTGHIIEKNRILNAGHSIILYAFSGQNLTNQTIRFNYISDCHTNMPDGPNDSTGIGLTLDNNAVGDVSGNLVFGNIIVGCYNGIKSNFHNNVEIINNTISDSTNVGLLGARSYGTYGPIWTAKNNVFIHSGTPAYHVYYSTSADENCVMDYNSYYPTGGSYWYVGGSDRSFAAWKSTVEDDANSITTDPALTNYKPGAASPVTNTGADLGAAYEYGLNPLSVWPTGPNTGSVRAAQQSRHGAGWEIGAFLYLEQREDGGAAISGGGGVK